MFKYWFGGTGEINQFLISWVSCSRRGNSKWGSFTCLMCLMKSKEIKMTKAEGVKGIPLGDEIREKSEVGSFWDKWDISYPSFFKLLVQKVCIENYKLVNKTDQDSTTFSNSEMHLKIVPGLNITIFSHKQDSLHSFRKLLILKDLVTYGLQSSCTILNFYVIENLTMCKLIWNIYLRAWLQQNTGKITLLMYVNNVALSNTF